MDGTNCPLLTPIKNLATTLEQNGNIYPSLPPHPLNPIKDYGFGALDGAQFGVEVVNELSLPLSVLSKLS